MMGVDGWSPTYYSYLNLKQTSNGDREMETGTCKLCKAEGRILDVKGECIVCSDFEQVYAGIKDTGEATYKLDDQSLQAIREIVREEIERAAGEAVEGFKERMANMPTESIHGDKS